MEAEKIVIDLVSSSDEETTRKPQSSGSAGRGVSPSDDRRERLSLWGILQADDDESLLRTEDDEFSTPKWREEDLADSESMFSGTEDEDERQRAEEARASRDPCAGLTNEQRYALNSVVVEKRNIFVTGGAGVGKSYILGLMYDEVQRGERKVAKVAPTGVAASLIEGQTIHSFFSVPVGTGNGRKPSKFTDRVKELEVLFIDEISMMDADLLERVDEILRMAKGKSRLPMGGVQVIAVGDFLQLPPVWGRDVPSEKRRFAFQSDLWQTIFPETVVLEKIWRQGRDRVFMETLGRIRTGSETEEDRRFLSSRLYHQFDTSDGIDPTLLFPLVRDVTTMNDRRLADLPTTNQRDYHRTVTSSRGAERLAEGIARNSQAEEVLRLKTGAQVMLLCNTWLSSDGLCNGSRGVVLGFTKEVFGKKGRPSLPVVRFVNGKRLVVDYHCWTVVEEARGKRIRAELKQIPLKLAWATTIHKSQGQRIDRAILSLGQDVFEYGQAYVALSRAPSLESISISSWHPGCIKANPVVLEWMRSPSTSQKGQKRTMDFYMMKGAPEKKQKPSHSG